MKKNRLRWLNLSKPHYILAALLLCLASLFALSSCADADGLHDQNALLVTFKFTGFGENITGTYAIPGNFGNDTGWTKTNSSSNPFEMNKGEGTSGEISVTGANIQFTVIPKGIWSRDWFVALGGKAYGQVTSEGNFWIDGLDLSAGSVTILVDASDGSVTVQ